MQMRNPKDRRTRTERGVTGYDRRKGERRRKSPDGPITFAPVAPTEYAKLQADELDFTNPKRRGNT
jgi:hypothetical protein